MHSTTIFLPLLAFAVGALAVPTPPHSLSRAMPNLHEVIRNPAPVDYRAGAKLDVGGKKVDVQVSTRAVPKVAAVIDDPDEIV